MQVPWWVWAILALYAAPGVYCAAAFLTMRPIGGLPEDGEEPPRRRPLWLRAVAVPTGIVAAVVLWPVVAWSEWRHAHRAEPGAAADRRRHSG